MSSEIPAAIVSLHPLDVLGGGELYVLNVYRSALLCRHDVPLIAPLELPPAHLTFRKRMEWAFVWVYWSDDHWEEEHLAWRDVLMRLASYELVNCHQFLACDMIFDLIASIDTTRLLVMTSHGYEAIWPDFKALYQAGDHHHIVSVSAFAGSMFTKEGLSGGHCYGAVWDAELREPTAAAEKPHFSYAGIGRMLIHKGYEISIEALAEDETFLHIGAQVDAEYQTYLEGLQGASRAYFLGPLSQEEKMRQLGEVDAVLVSSRQHMVHGKTAERAELFGLVVVESLAAGKFVIASDIPPFTEIMESLGLGDWLYRAGDAKHLRVVLDAFRLLVPDQRRSLIEKAQSGIRERFRWDDYWVRLLAHCTYGKLVKSTNV